MNHAGSNINRVEVISLVDNEFLTKGCRYTLSRPTSTGFFTTNAMTHGLYSVIFHQSELAEFQAPPLWSLLADIPVSEQEEIDEPFLAFPKGCDIYEIWHWFEDTFNVSVYSLMFPKEFMR